MCQLRFGMAPDGALFSSRVTTTTTALPWDYGERGGQSLFRFYGEGGGGGGEASNIDTAAAQASTQAWAKQLLFQLNHLGKKQ